MVKPAAIASIFFCLATGGAAASPLFDSDEVLDVRISGPFGQFIDERFDRAEHSFVMHADDRDFPVEIRTRGKSRMRVCTFPPMRLDFDEDTVAGTLFAGQNKLKLVTHCVPGPYGQANVMEEYSAHLVFNLLTDVSYRVRPLRVTYVDTDRKLDEMVSMAFVIESDSELAARVGGDVVQISGVRKSMLNQDQAALAFVFEYLVANTDWSLITSEGEEFCCHNGDLVGRDGELYYVPFDFDLTGLVDARYAKPGPALRISKVTSRLYRGYCMETEPLAAAIAKINTQRTEILAVFDSIPELSEKDAGTAKRFLERYFREAENEQKLLSRFEKSCI